MLAPEPFRYRITDFDREVFRRFVPADHPLRKVERLIDWEAFRPKLEAHYSPDLGQPALDAVRLLKLEFLRYLHNLSDRQVMSRAETDMGFRYFLQVGYVFRLPHSTVLCRFRGRLGAEGFRQVFDQVVAQARAAGLVKDRLRLKDASHVIASIAVPTTLALVAQIRERLLKAAEPFDPEGAAGQQLEVELLRERTKGTTDEERLAARVTHLRELLEWTAELAAPPEAETNSAWRKLQQTRTLAEKILHDREHPDEGRKTLSVSDSEARRGKHGAYYEGYLTDILMDADSGLITQVQVLEAGGNEAQDAVALVRAEEAAQGNDIESLSIDGVGFNGPMLRELEDPAGLNVTTYVPPKAEPASERFPASGFTLNEERTAVTCPAGQTSRYRQRDPDRHATIFRFPREVCAACPLARQCLAQPTARGPLGRSVAKNDYETEYNRARERAQSAAYAAVRKEHPAVERKLNEVLNHHGGRRARYRGREKVFIQQLMTCMTVNVKHFVSQLLGLRAALA